MVISLTFKKKQTMKKIFVLMASAAVLFAACNKMEEVNTPVDTPVETETITVVLNPVTKTSLDGKATLWTAGDKVSVTVGGKNIGTLALVEGSTFSGEVEAGHDGTATLNYPVDENGKAVTVVPSTQTAVAGSFANGAALLEGTTTMAKLRAGEGATLSNTTALLQFTSPLAGDVAFTIGSTTYTVEGCEAGETYYACIDPANSGKLSYTVGIVLGANEKDDFAPVANKVYPLGDLTLKESDSFSLSGNPNGWGTTKMYETTKDNFFVYYGFNFENQGGFKIRKPGNEWPDDCNFGSSNTDLKSKNIAIGVFTHGSSADIIVNPGSYDIYFDRLAGQVYIMESGKSYTEATKQTAPANTYYSLIGTIDGSNWDKDFDLAYSGDGIWTIVQTFEAAAEWKIRKDHGWTTSYNNVWVDYNLKTDSNGNIKMKAAGDYIITYVQQNKKSEKDIITLVKK